MNQLIIREKDYYLKERQNLVLLRMHMLKSALLFRTHNSRSLEEENLLLFINKCKEMLGIKKIFGEENEKVFRNFDNLPIVLNAIAQLSEKSERSSRRLKQGKNILCVAIVLLSNEFKDLEGSIVLGMIPTTLNLMKPQK